MDALTAWGLTILFAVFLAGVVVGLCFDGFFRKPWARRVLGLAFVCLLAHGAAHAQAIPEAPHVSRIDFGLYAADATIRTMDFATTYSLMHDTCRCYHEADPLSPSGKSAPTLLAFQYGITAAVIFGSRELRRHNHNRLARVLLLADITSESIAVGRNLALPAPPRQAGIPGVRKITEAR